MRGLLNWSLNICKPTKNHMNETRDVNVNPRWSPFISISSHAILWPLEMLNLYITRMLSGTNWTYYYFIYMQLVALIFLGAILEKSDQESLRAGEITSRPWSTWHIRGWSRGGCFVSVTVWMTWFGLRTLEFFTILASHEDI